MMQFLMRSEQPVKCSIFCSPVDLQTVQIWWHAAQLPCFIIILAVRIWLLHALLLRYVCYLTLSFWIINVPGPVCFARVLIRRVDTTLRVGRIFSYEISIIGTFEFCVSRARVKILASRRLEGRSTLAFIINWKSIKTIREKNCFTNWPFRLFLYTFHLFLFFFFSSATSVRKWNHYIFPPTSIWFDWIGSEEITQRFTIVSFESLKSLLWSSVRFSLHYVTYVIYYIV